MTPVDWDNASRLFSRYGQNTSRRLGACGDRLFQRDAGDSLDVMYVHTPIRGMCFSDDHKIFIYTTRCQNFVVFHACSTAETWLRVRGQTIHHSTSQADQCDTE